MRIGCVGGGPAGLFAATLLKRNDPRREVTVYEQRSGRLAGGWGVTFGAGLLADLRRADPPTAKLIADASLRWTGQVVDVGGERIARPGGDGYSITRDELVDILAERATELGVVIQRGRVLTALPPADLVVAADGANSRLREQGRFGTSIRPGSNKYLWLGATRDYREFSYVFAGAGSQAGSHAGPVWAYAYGIRPGLSTFVVECTARTWAGLGFGGRPAADCLPLLERLFQHSLDGAELRCQPGDRWQTFRTVHNETWQHGPVVLAGDAAHTTHFTIGSGTTLAFEDAMALSDSLREQPVLAAALETYQRRRKSALRRRRAEAHYSARWFESIGRYADLPPRELAALLHARRSPLQPLVPPRLFYQVHRASQSGPLRAPRRVAGNAARSVVARRGLTRCGCGCCVPVSSARLSSPSGVPCSDRARRSPTRSCPRSSPWRSAGTGPVPGSRCCPKARRWPASSRSSNAGWPPPCRCAAGCPRARD